MSGILTSELIVDQRSGIEIDIAWLDKVIAHQFQVSD